MPGVFVHGMFACDTIVLIALPGRAQPSKRSLVLLGLFARCSVLIKQDNRSLRSQGVRPKREVVVLPQELRGAATGHIAFGFAFRTLAKTAKSSQVSIGVGFEDENLNLVVGHTDVHVATKIVQRPAPRPLDQL